MSAMPAALAALIEHLVRLPGVGPKTAQRLAFHLLKAPREDAAALAKPGPVLQRHQRLRQCGGVLARRLQQVEGQALGRLGTDAGEPDQVLDHGRQGGRHSRHGISA